MHKGGNKLTGKVMSRFDIFQMMSGDRRRLGLPYSTCCPTFRATGIKDVFAERRYTRHAQTIANYESPRTTKLYSRIPEELSQDEIPKIEI